MKTVQRIDPIKEQVVKKFGKALEDVIQQLSSEERKALVSPILGNLVPELGNSWTILDLRALLKPEKESEYRQISHKVWQWLQDEARIKLREFETKKEKGEDLPSHDTVEHWANISNGIVPFGMRVVE